MKSSSHLICAHSVGVECEQPLTRMPDDFVPLRLVQKPGKLILVMSQAKIILGRHSLADVRLTLPYISRRHCLFQFEQGIWRVSDLDSLNGIKINHEKILSAELNSGDSLSIGELEFTIQTEKIPEGVPDPDTLVFHISDARATGLSGQFRAA